MTQPALWTEQFEVFSEVDRPPAGTDDTRALSRPGAIVATHQHAAHWLGPALGKIAELQLLPPNWDSYGAPRIDRRSAECAGLVLEYLAWFETIDAPAVAPTSDGEVGFCWDVGDWSLDVWVEASGRIGYVFLDKKDHDNDLDTFTKDPWDLVLLLTRW